VTFRVERHGDATAFLGRAGEWLLRREAENNLILGIAAVLAAGYHAFEPPIYLATVEGEEGLVGCAWRTPPFKAGLTRMPPEAGAAVAADMADLYHELPAVLGEEEAASAFAGAWAALRGVGVRPGMRQRIHELVEVRPPAHLPPGNPRWAGADDHERVVAWWKAFRREAGVSVGLDPDATVARRIEAGDLRLWDDGGAVSLAGVSARTRRGVRIGPVYTPPDERRQGYATALVADLSQEMLDRGRVLCFLYTDLANPTSNAIYAAVGYRPVCDVVDFELVARRPGESAGPDGSMETEGR
jgi:hypothetical protein